MNRYPLWKYVVMLVALAIGLVYTLPNFFGEAPAVQVLSGKATVKLDSTTLAQVEAALASSQIKPSAVTFDKRGFFTITLANGEVWRQEQGDSSFADRHRPAPRTRVTIRQGALGSANLKIQGDNNVYKVRRLR